jgi:uncharacterized protein YlxW (UPF0749 family)
VRPTRWRVLVPVVCLVAGLGFAASARDSRGTDLRAPGITSLADTVRSAESRVRSTDAELRTLQTQVDAAAKVAGSDDSAVANAQRQVTPLRAPGGLTAVHGPGVFVVLDDAPQVDGSSAADNNERLVHQSDLQAVVNALWAGGADAMTVAGQRIIATSAVRCVGPTLLLNGEVFSPPYRVAAIGPSATMLSRLASSPGVKQFRNAAGYFGLGYTVGSDDDLSLPAYTGSVSLSYARPGK